MSKKTILLFLILITSSIILQNCMNCDDCNISAAPKQLKIVNNKGENLVFGDKKKYDPLDIEIKNNLNQEVEFFTNTTDETIDFTFSTNADTYYVFLTPSEKETITFTYTKEKNVDCCNDFDVTKSTSLNGVLISNYDLINIVK
ncbi:MAG: hypothetical protein HUU47_04075 [Bacteroidetes bacterium]|nr:hypothetical protein [Bacteroidota bacterium]